MNEGHNSVGLEIARQLPQVLTAIGFIVTAVLSYYNSEALKTNASKVEVIQEQSATTDKKLDVIHNLTNSTLSAANERISVLESLVRDLIKELEKEKIKP